MCTGYTSLCTRVSTDQTCTHRASQGGGHRLWSGLEPGPWDTKGNKADRSPWPRGAHLLAGETDPQQSTVSGEKRSAEKQRSRGGGQWRGGAAPLGRDLQRRLGGGEEFGHAAVCGKSAPGRRNRRCKGLVAGWGQVCLRDKDGARGRGGDAATEARTHTRTRAHAHARAHTHTHTHTHAPPSVVHQLSQVPGSEGLHAPRPTPS